MSTGVAIVGVVGWWLLGALGLALLGWLLELWRKARLYTQLKPRLDSLLVNEAKLAADQSDWAERRKHQEEALGHLVQEKTRGFPWLSAAWADYIAFSDGQTAKTLVSKKRPAPKAAEAVREVAAKRREAEKAWRVLRYQMGYYETLFPWLVEFREEGIDEVIQQALSEVPAPKPDADERDDDDRARHWLTKAEYDSLPTAERYQRALDRYRQGRKTNWELGRDYERFIGYRYEVGGCRVTYQGIVEGFADLGRDLIVTRPDGGTEIVQCKYWSQRREIHEKHIFQLYGTLIAFQLDNPGVEVSAAFITSTVLTERAKQFAKVLGIRVFEKEALEAYPCIKCNVSQHGRIYHLPFDQQYDRTMIVQSKGESYVGTVAEAERLGFRRAMRWRGAQRGAGDAIASPVA